MEPPEVSCRWWLPAPAVTKYARKEQARSLRVFLSVGLERCLLGGYPQVDASSMGIVRSCGGTSWVGYILEERSRDTEENIKGVVCNPWSRAPFHGDIGSTYATGDLVHVKGIVYPNRFQCPFLQGQNVQHRCSLLCQCPVFLPLRYC